jgi:hypothetical protein
MKLPGLDCAFVEPGKIQDYLLNLRHPKGGSKASYFRGLGFAPEDWMNFAIALRRHAAMNPVVDEKTDQYGTRYVVDCSFAAADGTSPCIRTVWEIQPLNPCPRLITAHPKH